MTGVLHDDPRRINGVGKIRFKFSCKVIALILRCEVLCELRTRLSAWRKTSEREFVYPREDTQGSGLPTGSAFGSGKSAPQPQLLSCFGSDEKCASIFHFAQ